MIVGTPDSHRNSWWTMLEKHSDPTRYARSQNKVSFSLLSFTQTSHRLAWALMNNHLQHDACLLIVRCSYKLKIKRKNKIIPLELISFELIPSLSIFIKWGCQHVDIDLLTWALKSWARDFHQVTSINLSNIDLILHINMTFIAWLVPQLNASTSFFTLARFFGRQVVACPSPLLSTSKPFPVIFTISSHQVRPCVESYNEFHRTTSIIDIPP